MTKVFTEKKTLYIHRPLINTKEFIDHFKSQGFKFIVEPESLHVTIAFSKEKIDWSSIPNVSNRKLKIPPSQENDRKVIALGDEGAVVLKFHSDELHRRWKELIDVGCSWDFPEYQPHVTITYHGNVSDLNRVEPYKGELVFGSEIRDVVNLNWKAKVKEE